MTVKSHLLRLIPLFFLSGVLLSPDYVAAQALIVSGGTSTNISSGTNSYTGVQVGNQDSGNSLTISSAANVLVSAISYAGYQTVDGLSSNNSVLVTGSGSILSNSANTYVGYVRSSDAGTTQPNSQNNSLTISNGGEVIDNNGYVGFGANNNTGGVPGPISTNNSALVTGSGSLWSNSSTLFIGGFTSAGSNGGTVSNNSLTISNGGEVIDSIAEFGSTAASKGNSVLVTGSGSLWSNSSTLYLDAGGAGNNVTLANGGNVAAASLTLAAVHAPGTLNIGSLGGSDTAGVLSIGSSTITITGAAANYAGTFNFNQTDTFVLSNAISSGYAVLHQFGSGTTILSANNSNSGITTVTNGTLLAENLSGSAVGTGTLTVTNAGTLGGTGSIGQISTIASGGDLVPGVSGAGALSFTNGLTLATGSTTTFLINSTNSFTSINLIGKTLTNGGALTFNITSYTPAAGDTFTLFNMTGGTAESGDFSSVEVGSTFLSDAGGTWTGTNNAGDSFVYTDSSGQLAVVAAPEPSTYALLGMGLGVLAMVIAWRRRSFGSA